MKKFRQWQLSEMAARSRPRAQKLLNYIAKRQRAYTRHGWSTRKDTQIDTPIKHIGRAGRPIFAHPDTGDRIQAYGHAKANGKIQKVPLKHVKTDQPYVQKEVVAKKIQGKWKGHVPEIPHMVYVDSPGHKLHGSFMVTDGNHRVASSRLQGKTHIKAKVATVNIHPDYIEPEYYE